MAATSLRSVRYTTHSSGKKQSLQCKINEQLSFILLIHITISLLFHQKQPFISGITFPKANAEKWGLKLKFLWRNRMAFQISADLGWCFQPCKCHYNLNQPAVSRTQTFTECLLRTSTMTIKGTNEMKHDPWLLEPHSLEGETDP